MDTDLKNYTLTQLRQLIETFGQKQFLADYLFTFIHQKDAADLSDVTPLPKAFRQTLAEAGYSIPRITLAEQHDDPDGTVKFVFDLADGCRVETVLLRDGDRRTLCLSTQAGCRMGCLFCATARITFVRNLTAAEIVDQVYHARRLFGTVHNVVYMGMGEPLDNLDHVMRSVELLHSPSGANIGIRHITLSTCGLAEPIRQLAVHPLHPRLAVSLHAPDDATRGKLMRIGKKVPVAELIDALKFYQEHTSRRITIEYCLMDRVNDSDAQASELVRRLKGLKYNVNVIELNPFTGCPFNASPTARLHAFAQSLTDAGIETIVRYRRGRSIKAACGQLGATRLKPH